MPSAREVEQTARRAAPPPPVVSPAPPPAPAPPLAPPHPELAAMLPTADAPTLARLTRAIAAGVATSSLQVAYDLVRRRASGGRHRLSGGAPRWRDPATWAFGSRRCASSAAAPRRRRCWPRRCAGHRGRAARDRRGGLSLDRPDLLVAAVRSGAIPPPDARRA
jgi:hypothetical protein